MSTITGIRTGPAINELTVQGFKSVRDETTIACAPLTVLAGSNSSGKSSLIQPLLLLKQTFEAPYDAGPLRLDGPNVAFSDVKQLFWKAAGTSQAKEFTIGIDDQDGQDKETDGVTLVFERVEGVKKSLPEQLRIDRCTWRSGGSQIELREGMSSEEVQAAARSAILRGVSTLLPQDMRKDLRVVRSGSFLGLGVRSMVYGSGPWIRFERLLRRVIHVPALRGNPRRSYPYTAAEKYFPGVFSDYVASTVSSWQHTESKCLAQLGRDLADLGLNWKAEARQVSATEVELLVGRLCEGQRGGAQDMANIADVGFGVSQVLPVVAALLAAGKGHLVYVEQPEIHLHPRAQVTLVDLLARAVHRGVQVIVETHSELLLLGIQRLVAERRLSPDWVALHWVSRNDKGVTSVTTAELDEHGAFDDWPADFSEVTMRAMRAYLDASESETEVAADCAARTHRRGASSAKGPPPDRGSPGYRGPHLVSQ